MEDLADRFARLERITRSASIFLLGSGDKYTGPVRPVGIVRQTSNDSTPIPKGENGSLSQNYFVLADHVPLEFTLGEVDGSEPYPTGVVLARLSDTYDFIDWIPQAKTLSYLQAIFWCSDGSMESACAENSGERFTYQVVFRREGEQPRTEPPRARAQGEAFNTDAYSKGGWKTAVEQQYTHYQRLGLDPHQHVSAESVKKANLVRANWWRQRKGQADSGKNNPLIAELVPHFKIAETNLQMAVAVLSDVDQKAAYDRQIETAGAKALEEKLREFIRFTLRDKVLTPSERNDLLDQARDLGVTRERAEELIQDEMVSTGSVEADDTAVTMTQPRDPTTPVVSGADRPRLAISKTALSLGTLRRGQDCARTFIVDNLGGGVLQGTIDVSHPEWMKVSQPAIDARRHHQEVTIRVDTSNLALGKSYVGMVEIRSNGGRQGVRIDFSIELEQDAISRFRTKLFWGGLLAGGVFGLLLHALTPNAQAGIAITQVAALLGFLAFVVVCAVAGGWGGGIGAFVLAVFCDTALGFASTSVSSAVGWALIVSAFLYFCARRLLVANLAGDRRARGLVAATGVGLVVIVILCGIGVAARVTLSPSHPNAPLVVHWKGTVDNSPSTLDVFPTDDGEPWAGRLTSERFTEDLSIIVPTNYSIVLTGKSAQSSGKKGKKLIPLATFIGKVSADGRHMQGSYADARGGRGQWSMDKLGASVAAKGGERRAPTIGSTASGASNQSEGGVAAQREIACNNLSLRLYNVDDYLQASLKNAALGSQVILSVPERRDTGFVDISSKTGPGTNVLSLELKNYRGGYTYGFQTA